MRKVTFPPLPPDHEPVADLIARRVRTFKRGAARTKAAKWLPLKFPESRAFGVMWIFDPHLDDNGCNWPLLLHDMEICKSTPGLYAASPGDYRNNWVGRLVRIYAEQEATHGEGLRLARWFLKDAGMPWVLMLLGNHDLWNEGEAIHGLISDSATYVDAWEARVEFRDMCGNAWRVHAAHDFPGSSVYNKTHAPAKKAMFTGGAAELYVCGHRHTYGSQTFEIEETGAVVHAVRGRGYKFEDRHAVVSGFAQGQSGASVITIFNPGATTPAGRIMTFADVEVGAQVLAALRGDPQPKRKRIKCPTKQAVSPRPSPRSRFNRLPRPGATKSTPRSKSAARATARSSGTPKSRKRSKPK